MRQTTYRQQTLVARETTGSAVVLRETDMMRIGIVGDVVQVSTSAVTLRLPELLNELEPIKIRLQNEVHRFRKETRGVVRHRWRFRDGNFQIGVELLSRLTPLEVMFLRMGLVAANNRRESRWI